MSEHRGCIVFTCIICMYARLACCCLTSVSRTLLEQNQPSHNPARRLGHSFALLCGTYTVALDTAGQVSRLLTSRPENVQRLIAFGQRFTSFVLRSASSRTTSYPSLSHYKDGSRYYSRPSTSLRSIALVHRLRAGAFFPESCRAANYV